MRIGHKIMVMKRAANVFFKLLEAKLRKKRIPVYVAIQLTKYCNMSCNYCYVNNETYKNIRDRTKEELFELIDELYKQGMRLLWFLGGEPMVRKDFGEIIDYAHKKGIYCHMNSNGTFISEKNIDTVKKLDAVCVSIDGNEESNDYYRGKGSFKKAIKGVKYLVENDVEVRLHSILTKKTYKSLDDMVKTATDLGVSFNYCEVLLDKPDSEEHILTKEQSKEFYDKYLDYKLKGYPIFHSVDAIKYMMSWPKEGVTKDATMIYKEEKDKYPKDTWLDCKAGDNFCFIDLDGRVYACNGTWDQGISYFDVGFKEAWDYLADRACVSCKCIGFVELNLMLNMGFKYILHGIKNVVIGTNK